MEFCDIHAKLVPLFQYALSSLLDEGVEFSGEFGHAVA